MRRARHRPCTGRAAIWELPATAGAVPLSTRIRSASAAAGGVLCTAESLGADRALTGMFDRGYPIVCRDAAVPVGRLYALRTRAVPTRRRGWRHCGRAGDVRGARDRGSRASARSRY